MFVLLPAAAPEVYVSDTEVLQRLPALFLLMAGGCLVLQVCSIAAPWVSREESGRQSLFCCVCGKQSCSLVCSLVLCSMLGSCCYYAYYHAPTEQRGRLPLLQVQQTGYRGFFFADSDFLEAGSGSGTPVRPSSPTDGLSRTTETD